MSEKGSDRPKKPLVYRLDVFGSSRSPDSYDSFFDKPKDFTGESIGELNKASTQGTDDETSFAVESLDLVPPPYDLKFLSDLNTISVTRRACIDALSVNTAGLGYRIKRVDPEADETDRDDVSDLVKEVLEMLAAKGGQSFAKLIESVKYDEESNGNGYIEVSRNRKGEIDGLYHIPSHTVRVKKDRSGFVQIIQNGTKKIPFYNFGNKVELKEDGTIEMIPDRDRNINELIHFKLYSHRSAYYGVPRDISAIPTIMGDEAAREYNNKFFKFAATPELALVFEVDAASIPTYVGDQPVKVEIDPNTKREIEEHFRRNLAAKTFEPAIFHLPPGVKLKIEKLSEPQKDSGWTTFRKNNKSEIREAFRTPGVIVGGADTTYATAAVEKSIYLEQVIAPEQERYEQMLMSLFWPELVMIPDKVVAAEMAEDGDLSIKPTIQVSPDDGIGVDPNIWRLDFKEMSVADKAVDAQVHNVYATLGAITINEIRMQLNMKPLPDGDKPPPHPPQGQSVEQFMSTMGDSTQNRDIKGLGDGRGPNGQSQPKMPRRPFDQGGFVSDNADRVGRPLHKSEDVSTANNDADDQEEYVVVPKSYLDKLNRKQGD